MNAHSLPLAPVILTDRQEQFCQHILGGKSQTEAYRLAYGASLKACEAHGARLVRTGKVQARLEQLRAHNAAARRVSLPFLTDGLLDAAAIAKRTNQASAMAQAYMGIAKLHGFLIDKSQTELIIRRPSMEPTSPDEMTEEQWINQHALVDYVNSPLNNIAPEPATVCRTEPEPLQPTGSSEVYPSIDLQPDGES